MKKASIVVAIMCMSWTVGAYAISVVGVPGKVKGPDGKVEIGSNAQPSAKDAAVKKARTKNVSHKKVEMPEGSKHLGYPIDNKSRIESLCGHELGQVVKVPVRPTLDDKGNILITQRLKKPFRKCTQVTLSYSHVNHALYGIKLFSEGDKKMSEGDAWQELETMADAIKAKFGDRIGQLVKTRALMDIKVNMDPFTAQQFSLSARKVDLVKKSSMKGGTPDKGWVFTVSLVDRAMHDYEPEAEPSEGPVGTPPEGTDAL